MYQKSPAAIKYSAPTPDSTQALDFLCRLARAGAGSNFHLVAFGPGWTHGRTFTLPGEALSAADWVARENSAGANVYWTPNGVRPGFSGAKPKKEDMAAARALFLDLDPAKDTTTPAEVAAERTRLAGVIAGLFNSPLPPTVAWDTGGGYQALWLLGAPVGLDGPKGQITAEMEALGRGLALAHGGDSVSNVDRLLRLPGTVNWPDAKKQARGRTPALAAVTSATWRNYSRSTVLQHVTPAAKPAAASKDAAHVELDVPAIASIATWADLPPDLAQRMGAELAKQGTLADRWAGNKAGLNDGSRSGMDMAMCRALALAGFTPTEVGQLLMAYPHGKLAEEFQQGRGERSLRRMLAEVLPLPANQVFPPLGEMTPAEKAASENTSGARRRLRLEAQSRPDDQEWTSPADFKDRQPTPRRFVIGGLGGLFPVGYVTLLPGPGGGGKTLLAQQLLTSVATGRPFLGMPVLETGPALALFAEDDDDELERRQADINRHLGLRADDVAQVAWLSRVGRDNALARLDRDGVMRPTPLLDKLAQKIKSTGAKVAVIDNAGQTFHGNENNRGEVTAWANLLTGLARDTGCAIVLLAHPSKGEGSTYSGSTAWDGSVRQRLYLGRPEEADRDEAARLAMRDMRVLRNLKSNQTATGDELHITWRQGVFVVEGGVGDLSPAAVAEELAKQRRDDEAFLAGMDEVAAMGKHLGETPQSGAAYFVNRLLELSPSVRDAGMTAKRIRAAERRLLQGGQIVVGDAGKSAHYKPLRGYVRTGKPLPPVANLHLAAANLPQSVSATPPSAGYPPGPAGWPEFPNENSPPGPARHLPYTYGIEAGAQEAPPASPGPWADAQAVEAKPGATLADVEAMLRERGHG